MKNTAETIQELVTREIAASKAKQPVYFGSSPEPLPAKVGQTGEIVRVQEKVLPAPAEATGGGITSPLTEDGTKRTYHTMRVFTDSSRLILYAVKPIKEVTMMTSDTTPKAIVFRFAEPTN